MLKCEYFVVEKAFYCLSKFMPLSLQQNQASIFKIPGGGKWGGEVQRQDVVFFFFCSYPEWMVSLMQHVLWHQKDGFPNMATHKYETLFVL